MNVVAILFALGIVLLGFEVFVPGAILGILGGLALFAGCVFAFVTMGVGSGLAVTAVALALLGLMLYLEFVVLPKTRWGQRLFLKASISATSQAIPPSATQLIGRPAEAVTTLAPTGYVVVDGQRFEAYSQSGLITKGTALRVVNADNFRLIVART
jgi:membrane-bound ClpP family serine protease